MRRAAQRKLYHELGIKAEEVNAFFQSASRIKLKNHMDFSCVLNYFKNSLQAFI